MRADDRLHEAIQCFTVPVRAIEDASANGVIIIEFTDLARR
jgi:hypothetical protein